jgi:hypothetical protein
LIQIKITLINNVVSTHENKRAAKH